MTGGDKNGPVYDGIHKRENVCRGVKQAEEESPVWTTGTVRRRQSFGDFSLQPVAGAIIGLFVGWTGSDGMHECPKLRGKVSTILPRPIESIINTDRYLKVVCYEKREGHSRELEWDTPSGVLVLVLKLVLERDSSYSCEVS